MTAVDQRPGCEPRRKILATSRGLVECIIVGDGPAVIALHGAMGGCDQSWLLARALNLACLQCQVVAISRPGYLETPLDLGRSPKEQADVLALVLDELALPSAAIAAVSAGGPAVLQFALRHLGRCDALILMSVCSTRLKTPRTILARLRVMALLARMPGVVQLLKRRALSNPQRAAIRAIPDPLLRTRTLRHPEAGPLLRTLQGGVFEQMSRRLPGTLNDTHCFCSLKPMPLDRILAPTLVIHGTADPVVPFSHAQLIADEVAQAVLLVLEGGGHSALFTHLDQVRASVASFLRDRIPSFAPA